MRWLILIFFCIPNALQGQDSLLLQFPNGVDDLGQNNKSKLSDYIKKGRVQKLDIIGFIGGENVSKNRILVEYRLREIKNVCLALGVPKNRIQISRKLTADKDLFNLIVVYALFIPPKNAGIIFKTDKVEISEIELQSKIIEPNPRVKEPVQQPVIAKPVETKKDIPIKKRELQWFDPREFKKDERIVIRDLLFVATRHKIEPSSYPMLRELLYLMKIKPTLVIQLQGHVCCKRNGDDVLDWDTETPNLSENRARAVYNYLVRNGISKSRLSYVGFGSKYKLADDRNDFKAAAKNRRVEIYVVEE